jgi:hypothetical protein
MLNNRWKIIWTATLFNLLFEYSLRGFSNIKVQAGLPIILFAVYFTLFIMCEDLIVRYKLKAYQLMLLAFFYGTFYCAYTSGILYIKPSFMGIDWKSLLFVNIIWWGAIQGVLTFYLANMVNPRDWNHARLSKVGWIVCLVINFLAVAIFQVSGLIPKATPPGGLITWIIMAISLAVFIGSIKKSSQIVREFQKSKFLSFLAILTVAVFLYSAAFLAYNPVLSNTSNVNANSLRIIGGYTVAAAVSLLIYRFSSKKEIPV